LETETKNHFGFLKLAEIYYLLGKYESSIESSNKGFKLNPTNHIFKYYIGKSLFELKEYEKAILLFLELVNDDLEKPLLDSNKKSTVYRLLAQSYQLFNANYPEVVKWLKLELQIIKGKKDENLANCLCLLGRALYSLNSFSDSISYCTDGYKLCLEIYGENNINSANCLITHGCSLINLGHQQKKEGEKQKGFVMLGNALGTLESAVGKESKDYADALLFIATSCLNIEQLDVSKDFILQADGIFKKLGLNFDVAHCRNTLAQCFVIEKKYTEALSLFTEVNKYIEKNPNINQTKSMNFFKLDVLDGLYICEYKLGNTESAIKKAQEILTLKKNVFGAISADVLLQITILITMMKESGQNEQAQILAKEGLDMVIQMYGAEHEVTLNYKNKFITKQ